MKSKNNIGIVAASFSALGDLLISPFTRSLETNIVINESVDEVWNKIIAFENYKQWSPFIKSIEGKLEVGQRITIFIQPEGEQGMEFTPTVINAEKDQELRWRGKLGYRGVFDGEHYFKLEKLNSNQTHVTHGETFTGVLVPIIWALIKKGTTQGFLSQNRALKALVEVGI